MLRSANPLKGHSLQRLLGVGVEVRNEGLPLSLSDPLLISHATWVSKADRRRRSLSLSSSSAGAVSLCGGAGAQDYIDLYSAGQRAEVRAVLALDMPPSQTRSEKTHHELLAYPPDLHAPKVEGSVAVSQDLATKDVRA